MKPFTPGLALIALLPAALNPSLAAAAPRIMLGLCGQAGGSVSIPTETPSPPGSNGALCCAKGCHNSQDRKRGKLVQRTT